jgi:FtsP/CotA-like multicopper oxidase with cupredoxin domain
MFRVHHALAFGGCALAALAAVAISSPHASSAAPGRVAAPATAGTYPPCRPTAGGPEIKDPPLWTPSPQNHGLLILHARQTGLSVFCYVVEGQTSYYEAPTIQVHQGETWRMVLKNDLATAAPATPGPSPTPTQMPPHPAPTAADGCDQLGTMERPPVDSTGVLGTKTPDPRLKADVPMSAMDRRNVGDTNFHTHGWDVSPAVDNVFKSTTQASSPYGPRSCVFTFVVPLSQSAGTYWYHAHLHGVAATQVGGGLAGALIVLPSVATSARAALPAELPSRVIVIKNLTPPVASSPVPAFIAAVGPQARPRALLDANGVGTPSPAFTFPPVTVPGTVWSGMSFDFKATGQCGWGSSPSPAPTAGAGQKLMLNGVAVPRPGVQGPLPTMHVARSERVRIVNATSDSYVNLWMRAGSGGSEDLRVIARDGVDVDTKPGQRFLPYKRLLLAPSNRADVLIDPEATDRTLATDFTCTGPLGNPVVAQDLLSVPKAINLQMLGAAQKRATVPAGETTAAAFLQRYGKQSKRNRELTFTQYDNYGHFYVTDTTNRAAPGFGERPFWLVANGHSKDPDRYMLPNITVTQNDTETWTLVNAAGEIHAFHIHQMTFLTLDSTDPVLGPELTNVKLDSVALAPAKVDPQATPFTDPSGAVYPALLPSKTRILINFGVVHPGTFVYHCHMLAHEDSGMMGIITVLPRGSTSPR